MGAQPEYSALAGPQMSHGNVMIHRVQLMALCMGAMVIGACFASFVKPLGEEHGDSLAQRGYLYPGSGVQEKGGSLRQRTASPNSLPNLAWLMSFPNSGTTYTLNLVTAVTNMTVASNYDKLTARPMLPGGPFWLSPDMNRPSVSVLTKTHCGGFCHKCADPYSWLETPHSFMMHCGTAVDHDPDGRPYDYTNMVDRAVHLIRSPFDNLVARFHFGAYKALDQNSSEPVKTYEINQEGFVDFCSDHTFENKEHKSTRIDQDALAMIADVPCHLDLFRYIQWHNLAFITTDNIMTLPTHILHYEDYSTKFDETLENLLDFLELPNVGVAPDFETGKSYRDFFTASQIIAIQNATMRLASQKTWEHLERYFL